MDVIDEFNPQEWKIADEKEIEGFEDYNLFRRRLSRVPMAENNNSGEYFYCIQDSTDKVRRVTLSGCKGSRDPLTGVANCRLKLDEKKGHVIGIQLDSQCIVKK
ncbi:uncharacterized protein LOC124435364 [Xenia sp. Carnegie-2017]|uniref:uncharacterized protein LOC124435364 n=1 Tax=Xenia sp. Carnegie-2017 TaxID=2897299 RepID=UPI001F04C657|nr:uncharacterized protein LOC124435364 [Xenia sp. Carnegie-2017]XP_046841258.1 uncharacterized protein LOC124435364 [Xenia sp. Carnegie-2017]